MLTDKDICDIKELAYRSGMDYFIKITNRGDKPYTYCWQVLTTESGQYNKNYDTVLYQRIPFEGRTLYACVMRWYNVPNFASFEIALSVSDLPLHGLNLHHIYQGLHPDFELKNLGALPDASFTDWRPPLFVIDDPIPK